MGQYKSNNLVNFFGSFTTKQPNAKNNRTHKSGCLNSINIMSVSGQYASFGRDNWYYMVFEAP